MSQSHSLLTLSVLATVALANSTFITAGGAVATAAGNAFGVARSDGAIGALVPTDVLGTAEVIAGGAIAANAYVQVGANGKAITLASGIAVGIALQAAAGDGSRFEIYLLPNSPAPAGA